MARLFLECGSISGVLHSYTLVNQTHLTVNENFP